MGLPVLAALFFKLMKRYLLIIILIAAALMRYLHLHSIWETPLVTTPIIDSEYYHFWAKSLVMGQGGVKTVFFMSPLYPYFLSIIYQLFSVDPHYALMVQYVGGLLLIYLIYRLARELFDEKIALTSAVIAAFYQPFIYYEGTLLSAIIILILNAVALLILLHRKSSPWLHLLAGLLLGLSALARPNVLLFSAGLIFFLLVKIKDTGWQKPVFVTVGLFLILLPVGIRNLTVGGEFVWTTAGAGMNFFAGNNPDAQGIYWEAPFLTSAEPQAEKQDYLKEASRRTGLHLTLYQASKYWLAQGLKFITSHPLAYFQLLLKKLFLFFHSTEIPNNVSIYVTRIFSSILRYIPFTFGLVAPLGFFVWFRRKDNTLPAILHIYGLAYLLATLLFFAASEYRLPIMLVLIPLSAAGFWWFVDRIKSRQWKQLILPLILVLFLAVGINMPTKFTNVIKSPRMDFFNLGSVCLKKHDYKTAADMFNRAILIDLNFTEAHRGLGDAFHGLELYDNAVEEFKRAGLNPKEEIAYLDGEKYFYEAEQKAFMGDFQGAWEDYNAGIAVHPGPSPSIYYNRAFMSLQLGDTLRALDEAKIALNHAPTEPKINFLCGWIYEKTGKYAEALASFKVALEGDTILPEARAHAAYVCLKLNKKSDAATYIEPLIGRTFENEELNALIDSVAKQAGY